MGQNARVTYLGQKREGLDESASVLDNVSPGGGRLTVAGRTLDKSVGDWTIMAGAKAPEGAPNVLFVLIDDAGFGTPDTFGGPVSTPTFSRRCSRR